MFLRERAIKYIKSELRFKDIQLHSSHSEILDEDDYKRIAVEKAALEYALEVLQKGDE